uniref:Uncharacterized protein n=1 Tax=Candidatus Methanomethylicus mesodigestus TaxID=1867258 RepID=A0A7C3ERT3_9CREN
MPGRLRKGKSKNSNRRGRICPERNLCSSGWERLVCGILTCNGIRHRHRPREYKLTLEGGRQISYTPDMEIGDLIVEPHCYPDGPFLRKMAAFKDQRPDKKVILITPNDALPEIPDGIFAEQLPIEFCSSTEPSGNILIQVIKSMTRRRAGACRT